MIKRYKTIFQYGEAEHIIEKSRFIGYAKPVENEEDALAFIEGIKIKHKNATHNVPVYIIGEKDDIQRYSDDGEPAGTAGVPILDMLKKEEIKNTAIVVTRYFGGIKLGTGGLVRAYTATAKLALQQAKIIEKVLYDVVSIKIDYTLLGKVQNELMIKEYSIKETVFEDTVSLFVYVTVEQSNQLINSITNLTNGKAVMNITDTLYLNEYNGRLMKE
ncbi:YigZ family protein [Geosporobacter ferrireducens]|uniref:YigZ family protein n=1 Tax=Geosporobacter ferrireducens TaxID=1424294 RepID=A0A1D8GCG8_9FIRM|nr:YigZ family protein [Geosporobacter ferrireducens]AOT68604.1 YigZ family protein [Geosporobacter ferrireducens]MTI54073.1 YigZ family protein [Geosporobacter ferrireducens]